MPSARLKNLDSEKWHKISQAALQEFEQYGIHQASFNRIIRASGLSKGAVYYYFDSKEDLVQIMINKITEDLNPRLMTAHPLNQPDIYWAETKSIVEWVVKLIDENKHGCLHVSMMPISPQQHIIPSHEQQKEQIPRR